MKISIITSVLNAKDTIDDCIESILSQNYINIESIIIDGCSNDGTLKILKKYKVTKIISEPDNGVYDAMNKGIALATGEIIGILNSDDIYADDTVLEQVAHTFDNPETDACYSDLVYVDREDPNKVVRYWKSVPYENGLYEKGWVPAHPTFFVKKSIYKKYGNFDLNYKLAADYELMSRFMVSHKIKTEYIPSVLVKMRLGGMTNQSFKNIVKQNIEIIKACKKNGINFSITKFFLPKLYFKFRQFFAQTRV